MTSTIQRAKDLEAHITPSLASKSYEVAFSQCVQAVELYMQARKESQDAEQKKWLSGKCRELMKWGEELKKLKDEKRKEREREVISGNASVEGLSVAGLSISQGRTMDTEVTEKQVSRNDVTTTAAGTTTKATTVPPRKTSLFTKQPESKRALTRPELLLLWKSAKLPPHSFPPWTDPPQDSEFTLQPGGELFSDQSGFLPLSSIQETNFGQWKRARDIWTGKETMLYSNEKAQTIDLSQDVITDCSIVASLCAALERESQGFGRIVTDKIWPQKDGVPILSPNGKYIVKLWFNGCYRKVLIDDFLPTPLDDSPHKLFVTVNDCSSYLPPCLLEKAYLKAMGGYDFPGSNSGTDLLCFTGWIPEHLFLQSHNSDYNFEGIDQEGLWERVHKSWGYGDVLVTLGTGRLERWEGEGLAGEHDYAIIGMKEFTNKHGRLERWWLVKNPWKEGGIWTGQAFQDDSHSSSGSSDSDFDNPRDEDESDSDIDSTDSPLPKPYSKSAFWIDLPNVYRFFESIYLNWNPGLWQNRYDWHFSWDQRLPNSLDTNNAQTSSRDLWSVPGCFWANPQHLIANETNTESTVWILLSRHLTFAENASSNNNNRVGWVRSGYISLYLFASNGNKVYNTSGFIKRGPYVDSPQTLLRITVPPMTTYTSVVSSQDLLPNNTSHTFSISAFSRLPLTFQPANDLYPHTVSLRGSWTALTAGGNRESRDYEINPMFKITLDYPTTDLLIGLSIFEDPEPASNLNPSSFSNKSSPYIQVALLHSDGGKRVYSITRKQIIADSGEYCRHYTVCRATSVARGSYTIVASTFKPNQQSLFTLTVGSSQPLPPHNLVPLRSEDAGLYKRVIAGRWRPQQKKISHRLEIKRWTRAKFKVVSVDGTGPGLMRMGVWEESTRRWCGGGWNEDAEGEDAGFVEGVIRLQNVELKPERDVGGTWIVVERMVVDDAEVRKGSFEIVVLTDNVVERVGEWVDVTS